MKGGKDGPEKYYFFLPNNRSIQVSAQYSITCGNQRWQEVKQLDDQEINMTCRLKSGKSA